MLLSVNNNEYEVNNGGEYNVNSRAYNPNGRKEGESDKEDLERCL